MCQSFSKLGKFSLNINFSIWTKMKSFLTKIAILSWWFVLKISLENLEFLILANLTQVVLEVVKKWYGVVHLHAKFSQPSLCLATTQHWSKMIFSENIYLVNIFHGWQKYIQSHDALLAKAKLHTAESITNGTLDSVWSKIRTF